MPDDLASLIALRRRQLVDLKANADAGDDGAAAAVERVGAELVKLEAYAATAAAAPAAPVDDQVAVPAAVPATVAEVAVDHVAELRRQLGELVDHVTDAHARISRLEAAALANGGALPRF